MSLLIITIITISTFIKNNSYMIKNLNVGAKDAGERRRLRDPIQSPIPVCDKEAAREGHVHTHICAHKWTNGPFYNAVENKNGDHTNSTVYHSWVFTHEGELVGDWRGTEHIPEGPRLSHSGWQTCQHQAIQPMDLMEFCCARYDSSRGQQETVPDSRLRFLLLFHSPKAGTIAPVLSLSWPPNSALAFVPSRPGQRERRGEKLVWDRLWEGPKFSP